MARGIKAGWFPPLPETGNLRSLVHVDDVVGAMRCAVENAKANGQTYIVAERNAYSGRQIYDAIRTVMSESSLQWHFPAGVLKASGILGDALGALLNKSMPVNSEVVSRLLNSACYSPARIERELDWYAKVGLLDGLKEMLSDETNV
jgi:UDP-glucose 4-epimerase